MSHTWDLYQKYYSCPDCGFIQETRKRPDYYDGHLKISLSCQRCHHEWIEIKPYKGPIGPLFGQPSPAEFNWDT